MIGQHERAAIIKTVRKLVEEKLCHPWWSIEQIEDKAATIEALRPMNRVFNWASLTKWWWNHGIEAETGQ